MKKIYALCSLLLICIGVFSQTEIIDKDLQLGASGVEYLGYGKKLFFGDFSDNLDDIFFVRNNIRFDQTDFILNVGDDYSVSSCADKLTIISINVGSRESQVKGSSDFLWENLSDGQGLTGIASRYGIKSIPCFILIAPNGRIEKYWKGYAMHHSGMEKEIMEIILPNPSPTEASK